MACAKILIMFGLVALGFLIPPSGVAATAGDIGTKSSPEAVTNPMIAMVVDDSLNLIGAPANYIELDFNLDIIGYSDFIQLMRTRLQNSVTHGIPVLRPQLLPETTQNARWLDIAFVAGTSRITVRLEQSNLYVRGYRRDGVVPAEPFWELSDTRIIPGSRNLLFSGSYTGTNSIGSLVGNRKIPLGYPPLVTAISTLARLNPPTGGNNPREAARSLLVIIQMIAEAGRFRAISDHINANYYVPRMLEDSMIAMQNKFGQLSVAVMQLVGTPSANTPLPNIPPNNPAQVSTFGEARDALGMLLAPVSRGGSRSILDYGRCLMNLEYVHVARASNVFGTVSVDDGWYAYTFYDRSSGNSENVGPGGFATLTDPSQSFPVSGADAFAISVDLFDHNGKTAQEEIVWDPIRENAAFANSDKHLQRVVNGDYGDVTVGYSVLSNALGVTVQVVLVDADRENPSEIYGTLKASQVLEDSAGLSPITLFHKSSKDRVELRRYESLPLARTVFAASTSTQLKVTADLWDSLDDNIALGSANFTVRPGKQRIDIKGRNGQVEVVVTFA